MSEAKFVDNAGLATYTEALSNKLSRIYTPKGTAVYADTAYLASPVDPAIDSVGLWQMVSSYWTKITTVKPGWVYNISNAFETTSDFIEGAGQSISAGTNIVVINTGTDADPVLKFDALATGSAVSAGGDLSSKQDKALTTEPDVIVPDHTVADATARAALTTSTVSDGDVAYQEDTEEYYYAEVLGAAITWHDIGNTKTVEGALKLIASIIPIKPISVAEIQAMF